MSICIVDDNPVNLMLVERILKNAGYPSIITAESAKQLYRILQESAERTTGIHVDLILMDLMMPEIDGIEACGYIQQHEIWRDIPIIIVTALSDANLLARALDAGAMDYVMKPINKIELLARIRSALRLKQEKDWHVERDRRIREELELAKQVQHSVLSSPIVNDHIMIRACYRPSSELAGDMYAWQQIDAHRYAIMLYDVMGHGISSSLVCMFISSVLQSAMARLTDPEQVIETLNQSMVGLCTEKSILNYYFTAIYVLIHTKEKTIEYVNAGHPPGMMLAEDGQRTMLDQGSCAVGFFDTMPISKSRISYEGPIRMALYTDGLLELWGSDMETGIEQVANLLLRTRGEQTIEELDKLIDQEDRSTRQDDRCFILVDIH